MGVDYQVQRELLHCIKPCTLTHDFSQSFLRGGVGEYLLRANLRPVARVYRRGVQVIN